MLPGGKGRKGILLRGANVNDVTGGSGPFSGCIGGVLGESMLTGSDSARTVSNP